MTNLNFCRVIIIFIPVLSITLLLSLCRIFALELNVMLEHLALLVYIYKIMGMNLGLHGVAGQPEFESKDCNPQMKGVVLCIVANY
jgi:hypothetical protein